MVQVIMSYESSMPALNVSEVVELEKRTAEAGTSLLTLMGRAGSAVAQVAGETLSAQGPSAKKVIVLAGSGNNGGDGWVAASDLAAQGYDVTLVSKAAAEDLTAEPARTAALEALSKGKFQVELSLSSEELGQLLNEADLIIDAILGTGFAHSEVRAPYDDWIDKANAARTAHGVPILAVDCPSGLNAQTGDAATNCIDADKTITMIAAKTGLVQHSASTHVGSLLVAPIGVEA